QPLHIIAEAGEGPLGWGSPLLFAVSAVAGLTVSALIVLAWAFFGRGEDEPDNQLRFAQESGGGSPEKPVPPEKPISPVTKPPQEDDSLKIAAKPTALTGEQVYQKLLKSCVWIVTSDGSGSWTGSGSLVDSEERLVLTNHHVANTASKKIEVLFPLYDHNRNLVAENKAYQAAIAKGEGLP